MTRQAVLSVIKPRGHPAIPSHPTLRSQHNTTFPVLPKKRDCWKGERIKGSEVTNEGGLFEGEKVKGSEVAKEEGLLERE
ncbi:hypothetical protein Pmani_037955 [Petrolisthes manimaculis]|uniref:Uncharacterized protein n=1 Tax=Petrolisthes manimaculis TaxID=1843537 RepID=A0AAE1TKZ0_9EUCA|nr:hypothetical protein Pmani_037955 [Petrolisthes manimaculis]